MSGDIVGKLRKIASRGRMDDADVQVVFDAADEIERLRAEVESLTCSAASWRADAVGDVHTCYLCEARRGNR